MSRYINFYDPDLRLKRQWLALDTLVFVSIVLILVLAGSTLTLRQHVQGLERDTAQIGTRIASLKQRHEALGQQRSQQDLASQVRIKALRQDIEARERLLAQLEQRDPAAPAGYAELMRAFARQHKQGLWLTGFALDAGQTNSLELRGRTLDAEYVPHYVQRLRREAALAGYRFDTLRLTPPAVENPAAEKQDAAEAPYLEFVLGSQPAAGVTTKRGAPST
jgi:hypothetical protein